MWYVGIDVHKKLCHACIKDRDGGVIREFNFPNNGSGIDLLLEVLDGREARAVIESTGNLWIRLFLSLEEAGVGVILANPRKTRAIAEARLKNDKVDASALADLLRADLVAPCYIPPSEVREVRSLIRHRMSLVRDRTRAKNRVHALLDKYDFEGFSGTDLFGRAGGEWLSSVADGLSRFDRFVLDAELRHP